MSSHEELRHSCALHSGKGRPVAIKSLLLLFREEITGQTCEVRGTALLVSQAHTCVYVVVVVVGLSMRCGTCVGHTQV